MKKKKPYQRWFYAAGILAVCGFIHLFFDWVTYQNILTAVPFSVTILLNIAGFGGGAVICLLAGWILRRKVQK